MVHYGQELSHLNGDNLTPDHRNLLALPWEEKAALVPSFEGQLVQLAEHIAQLRRRPEFTAQLRNWICKVYAIRADRQRRKARR